MFAYKILCVFMLIVNQIVKNKFMFNVNVHFGSKFKYNIILWLFAKHANLNKPY